MADGRKPLVLVCGEDPLAIGGQPSYVRAHALAATGAGFAPHLFCAAEHTQVLETEFGAVHRVATPVRALLFAPAYHRPVATAIAEFLDGSEHQPPFAVHGFYLWSACAVSACAKLASRGIAAVPIASAFTAVAHEWRSVLRNPRAHGDMRASLFYLSRYLWARTGAHRLERRGYARASAVLVNYESVARLLYAAHGPRFAFRRVPYAAPAAFADTSKGDRPAAAAAAAAEADGPPLIVAVSRHDARKGLDVLLRALARLAADGTPFSACLLGPGRLLGAHRRLASRLGLSERVAIPGEVDDPMEHLRRCDVFVLPSLQEGSGSVSVLEALQAGTTIVASDCDGIAEDLRNGHDALLVPPGNATALAETLRTTILDTDLRAGLARNARRNYETRFTASAFTAALRDVYAELGVSP